MHEVHKASAGVSTVARVKSGWWRHSASHTFSHNVNLGEISEFLHCLPLMCCDLQVFCGTSPIAPLFITDFVLLSELTRTPQVNTELNYIMDELEDAMEYMKSLKTCAKKCTCSLCAVSSVFSAHLYT